MYCSGENNSIEDLMEMCEKKLVKNLVDYKILTIHLQEFLLVSHHLFILWSYCFQCGYYLN